jgi:hypothetical protein
MKTKMTVRYVSGREEQFEVDIYGGKGGEFRLKEFVKDPTLVLQAENELILVPASAIECITLSLVSTGRDQIPLEGIRKAKRLK